MRFWRRRESTSRFSKKLFKQQTSRISPIVETLEERRLLTVVSFNNSNWNLATSIPSEVTQVGEWDELGINSSSGIVEQAFPIFGASGFNFRTIVHRDDTTGSLNVSLTTDGTASPVDFVMRVAWTVTSGGTTTHYMNTVAGSGSYTLNFPASVADLTLVPDPLDDGEFEGNEIINFHLASGAGYTVDTNKNYNRAVILDAAILGETEVCTCGDGDDPGARAPQVTHSTNEAVEFVHKEHKPIYTANAFLPNIDNGDNPVVVGVNANAGSLGDFIGPDIPTPAYQAESHVKAAVVGSYPSSNGLYGFSVGVAEYQNTVGGTWTSAGIEDWSLQAGSQYNDYLYVNWTNWWFGYGWGIDGLNSLFVKDTDTADVDVDGNNLVLREGDGSLIQFHRKLVGGQAKFVPEPGPWAGTTVTTSTPEGSWFDVRKPDGTVEHYSRNTPDAGYVHYRLDYRKDADGSKTTYTYQDDPQGWFGDQRPWKITDKNGRTAVLAYDDATNHLTTITYDAASGSIVSSTSVSSLTNRLDSITDPQAEVSGDNPLTTFEYDSNNRLTAKKDRLTNSPLKERTTAWAYASGDLTQTTNPDGSVRTYAYSPTATGLLAPWAGFPMVRTTDELGRESRKVLDPFGNTLAEVDAEGNLQWFVRDVNGNATQETDVDPDGAGPMTSPTTTRVYDAKQNLVSETSPANAQRTWTYDSEFNRVTEEVDELGRRTVYKIDVTTTSPARAGTGNVLYKQEVVGTFDGSLSYDFSTGVVTGAVDDRVTSYLYTPPPSAADDLPGGLVLKEYDSLGRVTTYEYWSKSTAIPLADRGNVANHGKLKKVILPNVAGETVGSVYRTYTYDPNGYEDVVTDELGRATNHDHDALGRLIKTTFPDPYTDDAPVAPYEQTTYDRTGRPTGQRDKAGNWTYIAYEDVRDDANNIHLYRVTTTAPAREATSATVVSYVEYDAVGNQVKSVDGLGNVTTQVYDSLNRLRQTIAPDPDGAGYPLTSPVTTYSYDRMGRQVATTEPSVVNTAPVAEGTAVVDVTTAIGVYELDLAGLFQDGQDADSALTYTIVSNGSSTLFDSLSISATQPRKLVMDFAGSAVGSNVQVTVRATDTSGAHLDRSISVTRSVAQIDIEFRLNVTTTTGTQQAPAVAATAEGFVAVWEDTTAGVIRAQRFEKTGSPIGSEINVSQVASATVPSVAVGPNGRLVFTYWRDASGQTRDLYRRTFDAAGANPGSETLVASYAAAESAPVRAPMTFLANGESVIVWRHAASGNSDVKAQRYTTSDATLGSTFTVNNTTTNNQLDPAVAATEDGGFTVVWHGNGPGDTLGVFVRHFLVDGTAVGNETLMNQTITGTQNVGVLPSGAMVVTWYGSGNVSGENNGIYGRMLGADGTPASAEFLVNTPSASNEQRAAVSALPDGGFVVSWTSDRDDVSPAFTGFDVFARRFSSNGTPLESEFKINTTVSGTQTVPSVATLADGSVVVGWRGNGTGDGAGVFGRILAAYEPGNSQVGPFRVTSVTPSETVLGALQHLVVNFSGPVDSSTISGKFTVTGPSGTVGHAASMLSATQVLLAFTNEQTTVGNYSVTVNAGVERTAAAGDGALDQNLDGTASGTASDNAQFAVYLGGSETAPAEKAASPIPDVSITNSITPETVIDLAASFQDAEQAASELQYTIVSVSDDSSKLLLSAEIAETDGHTLVLRYNPGQTAKTSDSTIVTVTVRATDRTGRSADAAFNIERTVALSGTTVVPPTFRVNSISPYQTVSGGIDRFTVTFNSAVDGGGSSLGTSDFAVTDPSGATVTVNGVSLIAANQVLVTLASTTTSLGAYNVIVKPSISRLAGGQVDQNDDGATDTPDNATNKDRFYATFHFAPGPRSRTEYDLNSRTSKSVDAAGGITSYGYDAAGQQVLVTDPLGRLSVNRYDELGQLISTAQGYPLSLPTPVDEDGAVPSGSWLVSGTSGYGGDHKEPGSSSDYITYNFTVPTGKIYEIAVTWPVIAGASSASAFTVYDNNTVLGSGTINQQKAPIGHPLFGATWQTVGFYIPTIETNTTNHTSTLRFRLLASASGTEVADAVRIVEVSATDQFTYDKVGNQEYVIDARGTETKSIYDARDRRIATYAAAPDGANAGKAADGSGNPLGPVTRYGYNAAGELVYTIDPANRKTETLYDGLGRQLEVISPVADPNASVYDTTVDSAPAGFTPVNDGVAYGDSYYKNTSGTATWTVNSLTVGKYYQVLVTWRSVSTNTADAKYRVFDSGSLNREFHVDQRQEPSDWYEPDTTSPTNQDAWWRRLMVFKAASTSLNLELTRIASSGDLVADAVRVIEVGPTTSYRYDDNGNLKSVQQPDVGGTYARPLTEYTYDKHDNLTKITFPDPDGDTGSQYLTRSEVSYQYDDLDRRRTEVEAGGTLHWNYYDNLDRLIKTEVAPPKAPFDDDAAVTNWTWVTSGSVGYGGDHHTSIVTNAVLSISASGLTIGKTYRVLATWQGDSGLPGDVANSASTEYKFLDGANTEFTTNVDQTKFPTDYYVDARGWKYFQTFVADSTTATMQIKRVAGSGEAQADAIRLVEVTGVTTEYTYDPRGNLLTTKDPLGRVTQTDYDGLDRAVSEIDPLGARTYAVYDVAGQQTVQVDKLGRATTMAYDALSRVVTVTQPDPDAAGPFLAPVYDYAYDSVGNRVKMTEADPDDVSGSSGPLGRSVTDYTFDRLNRLTKVERNDPDAGGGDARPTTTYTYTLAGELDTLTQTVGDGAGGTPPSRSWKQEYDKLGRLTKVTVPEASGGTATGPYTTYGYDALSRKTSETRPDPDGAVGSLSVVTSWTYDNLGRLVQTQQPDPDGSSSLGRPTTTYAYDLVGNLTSMTTPDPYDVNGPGTAVIVTAYTYDYLNRRVTETRNDPDSGGVLVNQTTAFSYDLVGNQTKIVEPDPDGSSNPLQPPVTLRAFDALNREITTIDAREGVTRNTYDALGNRTSLTDPVLNKTTWVYDRLNRVAVDMNTFGDSRRFEYDAVGRRTREVDRLGRVTKWSYDPLNRRTQEDWFTNEADTGADRTITWAYDVADQLRSITDPAATYTYSSRDRRGNVLTMTSAITGLGSTITATNTFDDLDRRLTFKSDIGTQHDFSNAYEYYASSQLKKVTQDKQGTGGTYNTVAEKNASFVYNALGQTQKITRYSNVAGTTEQGHTRYVYDQYGHVTLISHEQTNNTVLASYGYAYDDLNRVKSADFTTAAEDVNTYSYDATDQLIGVDRNTGSDESYVHDLNGNRRVVGSSNWTAGTNNQLFRDGTYEYTYDKEGNLTKRVALDGSGVANGATTEYAWDNRNRLTTITEKPSPGGSATKVIGYSYDAFDLRVAKTIDNTPINSINRNEYYVWDGDDIVLDFVDTDGAGSGASVAFAKRYLWGQAVDQILAEETPGGATVWDLADNLGSVRDQMTNAGAIISGSHVSFDAFGKILTGTPATRFAFTGQEWDSDAGLYYYNARWYNAGTGKFLSEDPTEFEAGDANLTRMVGNSVTNWADPSGNRGEEPYVTRNETNYSIGKATRPDIIHDNGFLDVYEKRDPTASDYASLFYWSTKASMARALRPDLDDALDAYNHFLAGDGSDRHFKYDEYIREDVSGYETILDEIESAKAEAERLSTKSTETFQMTGTATSDIPYPKTENWQKAIGGHSVWGSADVKVTCDLKTGVKYFKMEFTLHAEDRYNFVPGDKDIATKTPDDENGKFELTGLGKQFDQFAESKRHVEWTEGDSTGSAIFRSRSGR